jgi:hypothetical protein
MDFELAGSNVNRAYSLAATSIAIFTFTLIFLYPRYVNGEANAVLFQVALIILGGATFGFALAAFNYYGSSVRVAMDDTQRMAFSRRGDRLWLAAALLLFLAPSVILFSVTLVAVGAAWFALWLAYLVFAIRSFPRVVTAQRPS